MLGAAAALTIPALARAAETPAWLNALQVCKADGAGLIMRADTGSDF